MLVEEQHLFLKDVMGLIQYADSLGFLVTGGELYRPEEMQKLYVQQGKSKTMASYHRKRLAVDLNFFKLVNGKWVLTYEFKDLEAIGKFWESLNDKNKWGGRWKDPVDTPHFERRI